MKTISSIITVVFLLFCAATLNGEELNYNIIHLSAEAGKQVDNNVLVVTMSAVSEANSAQEAAITVNNHMAWATNLLKGTTGIKTQTMNYQTHPQYKNRAIIGWSANQHLRLESENIEELSNLVGKLQEKLNVVTMRFEVSSSQQKTAANALISLALEAFGAKAKLVAATLGAKDYRIVTISVGEDNPIAPYRRAPQMEAMSASLASVPSVEAGESKISIRAEGSIQLVF